MGSIYQSIEMLAKEKGIEAQIIFDAVKDAIILAARKQFKNVGEMAAEVDPKKGIQVFALRKIVETVADPLNEWTIEEAKKNKIPSPSLSDEIRQELSMDALGRISAQIAKQVILQKVREAERENVYGEFAGRVGELVNCVIKRVETRDLVVDLGKTEARLPAKEQSKLESFSIGDRVRVVIKAVEKTGKNAGVVVSRTAGELVMRLFEQEVPEIYDNTVVIKSCAREAGERTKIAVSSRDRDVDSVGACVGMKGMRVQSIIRELRGEKIDIIEFSENPVEFATHALSPAKIARVTVLNAEEKHMEVIVDDTQLSLAIGKRGQNVRLAAKLLGWKIDIKSEEEKRQEVESQMAGILPAGTPIGVLADYGLPENLIDSLVSAEVGTVEKLGSLTPEELEQLPGVGEESIQSLYNAINGFYAQFEAQPEAEVTAEAAAEATAEPVAEQVADQVAESAEGTATEAVAEADAPAESTPEPEAGQADSDKL
ncbi:MAG: transcription termination/antitermination protein NusA [Acidobacteria bacterium]|nr:transcription termination/antitermination protein NusA [Acidobacteriota bacterium]